MRATSTRAARVVKVVRRMVARGGGSNFGEGGGGEARGGEGGR